MSTNLLPNSSFEIDTTGNWFAGQTTAADNWSGAAMTALFEGSGPVHGSVAAHIFNSASQGPGAGYGITSARVPVVAGTSYVASIYAETGTGTIGSWSFEVRITWFDSGGSAVGSGVATFAGSAVVGAYNRFSAFLTAPAGAVTCECAFGGRNNTGGNLTTLDLIMDAAQLEVSTTGIPGGYNPAPGDVADAHLEGQYAFGNILFNDNTLYQGELSGLPGYQLLVEKQSGLLELPGYKASGDYEDAASHGGVLGQDRVAMRTVTMDLALSADGLTAVYYHLNRMRSAFVPYAAQATTERLFTFRRRSTGQLTTAYGSNKKWGLARVRRFGGFDTDYESVSDRILRGSIEFVFPDPALYDFMPNIISVASSTGGTAVRNMDVRGNFRTYPVFVINGPVINPFINNQTFSQMPEAFNRSIRLATTIPAGQSVTIDTKYRTVVHSSGADWRQFLDPSSQWFYFVPGNGDGSGSQFNQISFQGTPFAAFTVKTSWYNAWI